MLNISFDLTSMLTKVPIFFPSIERLSSYPKDMSSTRIISWLDNNISNFGTENKLVIDIHNASITRNDINMEVNVAGIIKKQDEYRYDLNLKVLFILYNDSNQILATTKTEVLHTTTSKKFISLNQRNQILDNLTLDSLKDLSNKSVELLKIHMFEYIL